MLSHGLVPGALFLCVGVIYDRLHTREIERYGGLSDNMPAYALLFLVFTMASKIGRAPSELQSLMRISYAVFCLKKKKKNKRHNTDILSTREHTAEYVTT